jgi:hypothetical protein
MKKSKFWVVGLIVLLLACGMLLAGCEKKCDGKCGRVDTECSSDPGCGRSANTCNC